MDDKNTLMARIRVCYFVLHETALFLDTHPDHLEALEYYNRYNEMYKEARNTYTEMYGPITQAESTSAERWEWIDGPWPWEA